MNHMSGKEGNQPTVFGPPFITHLPAEIAKEAHIKTKRTRLGGSLYTPRTVSHCIAIDCSVLSFLAGLMSGAVELI